MKTLLMVSALLLVAAANYERPVSAIDQGGGRLTSGQYTIDSSVNTTGALTAGGLAVAKGGYVGQLYDPASVQVNLTPATVAESATRQLATALVLDDHTFLPLAPSEVIWSIVSGPLAAISGGGAVTAGQVYENTGAALAGAAAGVSGGFALTVLNVGDDDFGSYAGDGLDDDWQVGYFGLDNPGAAPDRDPDGDGHDNLFEFTAGIIPTDAGSRFRLRVERSPAQTTHRNLIFDPIVSGRSYTVEFSPTLVPEDWAPLPGSPPTSDNGAERTVTDENAGTLFRVYRVHITRP